MDGENEQFIDRRGWLIFFGIAEMLLGAVFLVAAVTLGIGGPPSGELTDNSFPVGYFVVFYLLFAGFFFAMGIGSAAVRSWARSIMVTASWFWLMSGTLAFFGAAVLLPRALPEFFTVGSVEYGSVLGTIIVLALLFLVAAPLILVLFYSGKNVKATFRRKHPGGSWAERCPPPALSLFLLMCFQGVVVLLYVLIPMPFLLFGAAVPGAPGALLWVFFGLAMLYAGYRAYKVHGVGWLLGAGLVGVMFLSSLLTYLLGGAEAAFEAMGGDAGGDTLFEPVFRDLYLWIMGSMLLFYSCYFAWLRKYFPRPLLKGKPKGRRSLAD
jgi:hypothetical protein